MEKDEKVRLALVGIGSWSTVIADGVHRSKKAKLVTCFTRTPEKRANYVKKYGCDQEESYEAVLKRSDVDGVILTTPNLVHPEQALLAAKYKKHIFVEKPIANTMADGRKMIDACKKAGVVLMVGHDIRRLKGFRKAKEIIDQGIIGKPTMVEANFSNNLGFELTPDKWRWYGDDTGCPAGALMTMGVHHADTLNYFFGPVKSAFAYFKKLYIPAPVEDVNVVVFQFESGVLGYIGCNYATPKASWLHIYGTEANLFCNLSLPNVPFDEYLKVWPVVDKYTKLSLFEKGKDQVKDIPLAMGDIILEQIDEFADCVRTGAQPETGGKEAMAALALIRAAIDSAKTGKQVELET